MAAPGNQKGDTVTSDQRRRLKQAISAHRLERERLMDADNAYGERECGFCGGPFTAAAPNQKYCSVLHKKYAWRYTPAGREWRNAGKRRQYHAKKARLAA